jgi:hypothetical protein
MSNGEKCAHPMCSCMSAPDRKYCSTYCETTKDIPEFACQCGHPARTAAGAQVAQNQRLRVRLRRGRHMSQIPSGRFRDRRDAGCRLGELLAAYANQPDVIVLGLARGGVPAAYEISEKLDAPLRFGMTTFLLFSATSSAVPYTREQVTGFSG